MLLFCVGYIFNYWLNFNLVFQYYYISGDDNFNDNCYGQFEWLFGGRCIDLNNIFIYGLLIFVNLMVIGFCVEFCLNVNWDGRVYYFVVILLLNIDSFVIGKY